MNNHRFLGSRARLASATVNGSCNLSFSESSISSLRIKPLQSIMAVIVVALLVVLVPYASKAEDLNAAGLLEKMSHAYSNLNVYSDSGVVETVISQGGRSQTLKKPFSIKFKKPGLIRIEWTASFGGMDDPFVLWSCTNGTFTYSKRINQVLAESSLDRAISRWTGVSGGSVKNIPEILLLGRSRFFGAQIGVKREKDETFENTDCYKVIFERAGMPVALWIGKHDYLLRKLEVATRGGVVTEIHRNIDMRVKEGDLSFEAPADAKQVERFQYAVP